VANLKLVVPGEKIFHTYDYGTAHTFKVYTEDAGSGESAFNATGYTGYVKFFNDEAGELVTELSPSWTTQSSGIGTFQFSSTNNLNMSTADIKDTIYMEVQLEKSGTIISTNRVRITVTGSPTGTRLP
jgi:hypothetical protein